MDNLYHVQHSEDGNHILSSSKPFCRQFPCLNQIFQCNYRMRLSIHCELSLFLMGSLKSLKLDVSSCYNQELCSQQLMAKGSQVDANSQIITSQKIILPKEKDSYKKGRISKLLQNCTSGCYFSSIIKHLYSAVF